MASKTDITVGALVEKIKNGELLLPEMQRRYVWPSTRVRDLLDSLYRGYPSGAILVWESEKEVATRGMAVSQTKSPWSGHNLLLDGQQRLTSLSAVLRGEPVMVRNRKKPIDILFNLEHPEGPPPEVTEVVDDEEKMEFGDEAEAEQEENEELSVQERLAQRTFVVSSKALLAIQTWIRVSDVFNEKKTDWDLIKPLAITPDDPRYDKYTKRIQRLRGIRNYQYVMHVLGRDLSYEEVAEIFVRVNSLGIKLRGSDLALAQITAKWPNSLKQLETYAEECDEKTWFTLDVGLLVRTIVVFATQQSRFHTVGSLTTKQLEDGWEKAKRGLDFAVNFLRSNAGIEDESLLSSPFLIIPIAVYGVLRDGKLSSEDEKELLRWSYVANARGHYSRGSSETVLDADLSLLFKGVGPKELIERLRQQFGRLHVEPADLIGKGTQSPLFAMAFVALKKQGAKDWMSGLGLSLTHQGKLHYVQHHHIFPKSLLKERGVDKSEINEIANFAFVSGRANRAISNKEPAEYLPGIMTKHGKDAIEKQLIPMDQDMWKLDRFADFLRLRREALAGAINALMQVESVRPQAPVPAVDVAGLMAKGENARVEFKASTRWDYREKRVNKILEHSVLKTIAAFMNSSGGTLLVGVDDTGKLVGLAQDYQTLNKRPNADGYEQYLIQVISAQIGKEYCPYVHIGFHKLDGAELCAVQVQPSTKPAYLEEGSEVKLYVRTGNTTQALNAKELVAYTKDHWGH